MTRSVAALLAGFALGGCSEMMSGPDGGFDGGRLMFDAGPPPIVYTRFTRRSDGWPMGGRVVGAGLVGGVLYAATTNGVVRLPVTDTAWTAEPTPLSGDQKPTSFQRVDQQLVMTAAGASTGGLFLKELDGAWAAVPGAPTAPAWALVKKSNEWLLATTGGLYIATSLAGAWTRRTPLNTPLFAGKVERLLAAPGQQKLFASGLAMGGALFESNDLGVTWAMAAPRGAVEALAGASAVVVLSTAMDGQQRSDNYGNTFRPAANPIADGVLFYAHDGTNFWAGGNGGLKRSTDLGLTFTDAANGLPTGTPVLSLVFAGSYLIADTTDGPWLNQN